MIRAKLYSSPDVCLLGNPTLLVYLPDRPRKIIVDYRQTNQKPSFGEKNKAAFNDRINLRFEIFPVRTETMAFLQDGIVPGVICISYLD